MNFDLYNGAMGTQDCFRLKEALQFASSSQNTKALVLVGNRDFWSNGINLNTIEGSANPAAEAWNNIQAIDDLVKQILNTHSKIVVSAIEGNAGAGGVAMALAADHVMVRDGSVLNMHYKNLGLYGSEYWTYSLPKRVGSDMALQLTETCPPLIGQQAL